MIKGNPFLSDTFSGVWKKHFYTNGKVKKPEFLAPLTFAKHPSLPVWHNMGSTLTKGIDYQVNLGDRPNEINDTYLIFDVPSYFNVEKSESNQIGFLSSKQYPGYLIDLDTFTDFQQFMQKTFSKSSRYKLNKYKRRLEECFDITYKMVWGDVEKKEYNEIFESFRNLLEKRFDDKEVYNNNLDTTEWNFYKEVAYPLLLDKKAALYVIYDQNIPIGVTLNYFSEEIIFDAITVFDIDYAKFHLGSVTIMKLIEWGLENNFKIFDFSKGHFEYKTRWATRTYDFEYHIYFNKKSIKSKVTANSVKKFFDLKQNLREKNLNERLHKLTYGLKNQKKEKPSTTGYNFIELENTVSTDNLDMVTLEKQENNHLKTIAFEFLYLNNECMKNLKIFKVEHNEMDYLFVGNLKQTGVQMSK
ncbi:MAG: hypothetical protein CML05_04510 [Pseudozobellia sp.]|nr:hypothetical protein [Pseudozobellia sp.]|tara:strand:- start:1615 stop:2859 length:1245 start_codon:yes stop_codon:yes gene_type:complete